MRLSHPPVYLLWLWRCVQHFLIRYCAIRRCTFGKTSRDKPEFISINEVRDGRDGAIVPVYLKLTLSCK